MTKSRIQLLISPNRIFMMLVGAAMLLFTLAPVQSFAQGLPGKTIIDAIMDNNLAILRREVLNGVSVNQRDSEGVPAIVVAAKNNRYYLIDFLIESNVNINAAAEDDNETALMAAADEGYIDIVEQLIDAGADLDNEDDQGETALIKAVRRGNLRIVRTLADAGADLNHTDYTGRSALAIAEENRDRGILRFLETRNATY